MNANINNKESAKNTAYSVYRQNQNETRKNLINNVELSYIYELYFPEIAYYR